MDFEEKKLKLKTEKIEKNDRSSMLKTSTKHGNMDERAPSPLSLTPPTSPKSERRETRGESNNNLNMAKEIYKDTEKDKDKATSPINIPFSKAKNKITPGLEATSLNSLAHVPSSKFLVGRSHYSSQPITIEYYVTERLVDSENEKNEKILKQATTIRSIGDYQIIRTVGSGSTGKVKLGVNIRTQKKVAIKIISRRYINDTSKKSKETPSSRKRRILREAAILNLAHHPNIVRLHDLYVTDEYYCMVFDYVDGGQMLDYIISHGKLKEAQAQKFFLQLLSAVSYCHDNGIVHRDLKIENVLIDSQGDVKLVDFGLSNFYDPTEKLKTFCGSLYFAAPELLKGIHYTGPEIDVWSLGIILYVLVCGKVPFDDKSLTALHEKIKLGLFLLPPNLSAECQNLLKSMIEVDPMRRARVDEVLKHPWVRSGGHVVQNFSLRRNRLTFINPDIEAFLIREFSYQFDDEEIRRVLRNGCINWEQFQNNPIIALYFLAAQKQQRQLTDPFSSSPQIPSLEIENINEDEESCSFNNLNTMVPLSQSYDPSSIRRRAESLPVTNLNVPDVTPMKVMKSKRSSSLQGEVSVQIPEQSAEINKNNSNLAPRSETQENGDNLQVRTVYLRGIFSVNTTSIRPANEIREIITKCLTDLHKSIIFLDRESYFICEYQSSVTLNRDKISLNEDDEEAAHSFDDVDISQIDLAEGDDKDNQSSDQDKEKHEKNVGELTFGAAPLRSIRFEIHIVKVALLGMNGIQFKRISGDFGIYKNLCSQLISEFNL